MTEASHGVRLMRRVIDEHRRVVALLAGAFVINVLVYAFGVRPLSRSVANVQQSTLVAGQALTAARAEEARASGTLTGKDRAAKELETFYSEVLARDLAGARRLTYGRLARLAADSRLEYEHGRYEPVDTVGSTLTKLKANVELTGTYANVRTFIHAIETAPEFVVIDNLELVEGGSGEAGLRLEMELSTYFRSAGR